jgi:hypothetical protein
MATVSMARAEEAFIYWMEVQNLSQVSRDMDIPQQTLSKWKNDLDWEERSANIQGTVRKAVDGQIANLHEQMTHQAKRALDDVAERFVEAEAGTVYDCARAFDVLAKSILLLNGEPTAVEEKREVGVTIDFSKLYNMASENRVVDVTPGDEEEDVEDPSLAAGRVKVQEGLLKMGVTLSADGPDAEAAAEEA